MQICDENPCSTTDFICAESTDKPVFVSYSTISQTTVTDCATYFVLSDVFHCTNMKTDFMTSGNNILLQTLIDLNQCITFRLMT